jgi:hypothetical protein
MKDTRRGFLRQSAPGGAVREQALGRASSGTGTPGDALLVDGRGVRELGGARDLEGAKNGRRVRRDLGSRSDWFGRASTIWDGGWRRGSTGFGIWG